MTDNSVQILSALTTYMKYAKFIPEIARRETWEEICERNMAMHIRKYPMLRKEIQDVYKQFVYTKKVLPSMRSMQFGGRPIELAPNRIFNCAFSPCDHPAVFSETMFLLLGGTGMGYSVQRHHVSQLPAIQGALSMAQRHLVGDNIEGWADAVKVLVESYFYGKHTPTFDFSDIRPKGAPLVTSGGKAPGAGPLKTCIFNLTRIFDKAIEERGRGTRLEPLEVHDMMCHIADAVLAGGIRRAALICLFSMDDKSMLKAKGNFSCTIEEATPMGNDMFNCTVLTKWKNSKHQMQLHQSAIDEQQQSGKLPWYMFEPQRGRANNSAVILRHVVKRPHWDDLWNKIVNSGSGEPGVYFSNDKDWGTNPSMAA